MYLSERIRAYLSALFRSLEHRMAVEMKKAPIDAVGHCGRDLCVELALSQTGVTDSVIL